MHQADLVLHGSADDEFAGIQHDAVPAAVPRQPQLQDRHARLHGDADDHVVGQRQLMRGGVFLLGNEQRGQFAQRGQVFAAIALHEWQRGDGALPQVVGDRVVLQLAGPGAGAQECSQFAEHRNPSDNKKGVPWHAFLFALRRILVQYAAARLSRLCASYRKTLRCSSWPSSCP
ncbi:hypothetical protein D9M68_807890 [compost metagenome]